MSASEEGESSTGDGGSENVSTTALQETVELMSEIDVMLSLHAKLQEGTGFVQQGMSRRMEHAEALVETGGVLKAALKLLQQQLGLRGVSVVVGGKRTHKAGAQEGSESTSSEIVVEMDEGKDMPLADRICNRVEIRKSTLGVNPDACTVLVTRTQEAEVICDGLWKSPVLGFDCEGISLGYSGKLCLLQLSDEQQNVFLFDITVCPALLIEGSTLRRLLESSAHIKVIHDCSCDISALVHQYNIHCQGIYDTACAVQELARMAGIPKANSFGVNRLLELFGIPIVDQKVDVKQLMRKNWNLWDCRPLSAQLIEYSSGDVRFLVALYHAFCDNEVSVQQVLNTSSSKVASTEARNPFRKLIRLLDEASRLFHCPSFPFMADWRWDLATVYQLEGPQPLPESRMWLLSRCLSVTHGVCYRLGIPPSIKRLASGKAIKTRGRGGKRMAESVAACMANSWKTTFSYNFRVGLRALGDAGTVFVHAGKHCKRRLLWHMGCLMRHTERSNCLNMVTCASFSRASIERDRMYKRMPFMQTVLLLPYGEDVQYHYMFTCYDPILKKEVTRSHVGVPISIFDEFIRTRGMEEMVVFSFLSAHLCCGLWQSIRRQLGPVRLFLPHASLFNFAEFLCVANCFSNIQQVICVCAREELSIADQALFFPDLMLQAHEEPRYWCQGIQRFFSKGAKTIYLSSPDFDGNTDASSSPAVQSSSPSTLDPESSCPDSPDGEASSEEETLAP